MDLLAFCLYKYIWVTIRGLRVFMYLARFPRYSDYKNELILFL
jgi:hypothetical protein